MWFSNPRDKEVTGDQILFKILNGYENIDKSFFSLNKDYRTSGHEVTLIKDQCRLE